MSKPKTLKQVAQQIEKTIKTEIGITVEVTFIVNTFTLYTENIAGVERIKHLMCQVAKLISVDIEEAIDIYPASAVLEFEW